MELLIDPVMGAKITIIGVGGGGGNAVNNMIESSLEGVSFLCANTDLQALDKSKAMQLQLGKQKTRGLGSGGNPEVGKAAAEESLDDIQKSLEGVDMVFITAGMGGGTGTGAAPVIAKVAKEKDILTVGVVTKPFEFEGKKRMATALKGIEEFSKQVDSLVIIPNEKLKTTAPKNAKVIEMFKKADEVLYAAVRGVTDLITKPGLINADFADLCSVMKNKGMALMGEGRACGENRALEAAKLAITNPLLDDISLCGCKALLVNVTADGNLGMDEFYEANQFIKDAASSSDGEEPEICMAMSVDENCGDEIHITVVATGIEMKKNEPAPVTKVVAPNTGKPDSDSPIPQHTGKRDARTILKQFSEKHPEEETANYTRENDTFKIEEYDTPAFMRKQSS